MQLTGQRIMSQDSGSSDLALCPSVSGGRRFVETRLLRNVAIYSPRHIVTTLNSSTLLCTATRTTELGPGSNTRVPGSNLVETCGILRFCAILCGLWRRVTSCYGTTHIPQNVSSSWLSYMVVITSTTNKYDRL